MYKFRFVPLLLIVLFIVSFEKVEPTNVSDLLKYSANKLGLYDYPDNPPTKLNLSDSDKAYLLVQTLTDAINDPTGINLYQLKQAIPGSTEQDVLDLVNSLNLGSNSKALNNSPVKPRISFEMMGINDTSESLTVSVKFLINYGQYAFPDSSTITFSKSPTTNSWSFKNINPTIDKIKAFSTRTIEKLKQIPPANLKTSPSKSLDTPIRYSPNLLVPKTLVTINSNVISRFNTTTANDNFNGNVFSRPYGIAALDYEDPVASFNKSYLMVTDANWDRVIASQSHASSNQWINAQGSHGSGNQQFKNPQGIDVVDWKWIVADGYNNRAVLYKLDYTDNLQYMGTLTGSFDFVADVAAARFDGTNELTATQYAVLDKGNCKIITYNYDGEPLKQLFSCGSSYNQILEPTSIAYARSYITGYYVPFIFVADNGNKRVVSVSTFNPNSPFGYRSTPTGMFPQDAYLSGISVDPLGYPHVVDNYNSVIYKLNASLTEIVATYGSKGGADGELLYPNRITFTQGWSYVNENEPLNPIQYVDAFVTEFYGQSTGIRRFIPGNDILSSEIRYYPQPVPEEHDRIICSWYQTGATEVDMMFYKIFFDPGMGDDILIESVHEDLLLPGYQNYTYWPELNFQDGMYRMIIHVTSKNNPSMDTTFSHEINLYRYYDPENCYNDSLTRLICDESGTKKPFNTLQTMEACMKYKAYHPDGSEITDHNCILHPGANKYWKIELKGLINNCDDSILYRWTNNYFYNGVDNYWFINYITTDTFIYIPTAYNWRSYEPFRVDLILNNGSGGVILDSIIDTIGYIYQSICSMPDDCQDCTGGGGGCPMLYSWDSNGFKFENNLLPQSEYNNHEFTDRFDYYPIFEPTLYDSSYYRFEIREDENEKSYFDQIDIYKIDIPKSTHGLVFNQNREFGSLTNIRALPSTAVVNNSQDVLSQILHADSNFFISHIPGSLEITYNFESRQPRPKSQANDGGGPGPIRPPAKTKLAAGDDLDSIPNVYIISAMNESGQYEVVTRLHPRRQDYKEFIEMSSYVNHSSLKIKIEWTKSISIDNMPYYEYRKIEVNPVKLNLAQANHSAFGSVTRALKRSGDRPVTLEPNQQIELLYDAPPVADSMKTVLFVKAKGKYEPLSRAKLREQSLLPTDYNFSQNYPNPFNPSTIFEFSLPNSEHVVLEIYNILGQKVTTLINQQYDVGHHNVIWDGNDESGGRVSSGVYFAKFKAGAFNSSKKMVVVK